MNWSVDRHVVLTYLNSQTIITKKLKYPCHFKDWNSHEFIFINIRLLWMNINGSIVKCMYVVWEKFMVGIFHVKKFHVKIFSSSWVTHMFLGYKLNGNQHVNPGAFVSAYNMVIHMLLQQYLLPCMLIHMSLQQHS